MHKNEIFPYETTRRLTSVVFIVPNHQNVHIHRNWIWIYARYTL